MTTMEIKLTDEELATWTKAAEARGLTLEQFLVDIIQTWYDRAMEPPALAE